MTIQAVIALCLLIGIAFGLYGGYTLWGLPLSDAKYDLWAAEDQIRDLEPVAKSSTYWYSEAQRLRRQHAGTPYIQGRDKYYAWGEDAA